MSAGKMSGVRLILGLVLLIAVASDAMPHSVGHPDMCCFTFTTSTIRPEDILKDEKISPKCPRPGYVVTTLKGRVCVKKL
ncbi:C-C motif chemokine 14-like [Salminus brasiliensis]|uniref:C-C motif chemokine 14-like n=1 Tax=Salminus brasiliensis TaxID=930266 RepID=UPI003B82F70F